VLFDASPLGTVLRDALNVALRDPLRDEPRTGSEPAAAPPSVSWKFL